MYLVLLLFFLLRVEWLVGDGDQQTAQPGTEVELRGRGDPDMHRYSRVK